MAGCKDCVIKFARMFLCRQPLTRRMNFGLACMRFSSKQEFLMSFEFPRLDTTNCPIVSPPSNLTNITLLPFQIEGCSWMIGQEKRCGGGILADDMGMGKTIQSIALILKRGGSTLVVCPATLTTQWLCAFTRYAPSLRVILYHGESKVTMEAVELCDVCITSYDTLASLMPQSKCSLCDETLSSKHYRSHACFLRFKRKRRDGFPIRSNIPRLSISDFDPDLKCLLNIEFDRCILDECHAIKNPKSRRAKACSRVLARFRWCLSGTPFQNKLGEVASLLRFLRYDLGELCSCKSPPCDYGCLNVKVKKDDPRLGNRFDFLERIFGDLVLRRIKENYLELPMITYEDIHVELNSTERENYDRLYRWFYSDANLNGPDRYLDYILRLRQTVVSPALLHQQPEHGFCLICLCSFQKAEKIALFDCGHACHASCAQFMTGREWCPECLSLPGQSPNIFPRYLTFEFDKSSKVDAIVSELLNPSNPGDDKTLVFTCFKGMGPRICRELAETSLRCGIVDGSVTEKRRQLLYADLEQDRLDVLIFTLGCGSVGLNLQVANSVLVTCPWWNPAIEDQAIARCYRLGQRKPVRVKRFIADGTIDERIVELQSKKRLLAKAVLNGTPTDLDGLDLKFLLGFGESQE